MDDLNIRALQVLSEVATQRSFRAAAQILEMSPSSVSHMIGNLEQRLGIRLLQRNTRSVSLTEAGTVFLTRVRPALGEIQQAVQGVNDFRDQPAGQLRINASQWGAERLLPTVLAFMPRYPDVQVDLVCEDRVVDIIQAGFDAGLRLESVVPQDMVAVSLGIPEAMILVASPTYLERNGTPQTPGDLTQHEAIRTRLPSGAIKDWQLMHGGEPAVPKLSGRLILGSTSLAMKAAISGLGVAWVEQQEASSYLASGALQQIMRDWTPSLGSQALYFPPSQLKSGVLKAFVEFVRQAARNS